MTNNAIVCIDDEVILLLALIQELKRYFGDEYIYERAVSAEEAFNLIDDLTNEGINVGLIITDWLMPGIRGDEMLDKISQKYPHVKAIIITGQADGDAVERMISNSSVVAVLQKPWDRKKLVSLIQDNYNNAV